MGGGGAERQLTYLAAALREAGCEVHVAVTRGGPNLSRLEAAGATVHRLQLSSTHDPRILCGLRRVIAAVGPDVVQCWIPQMHIAGGLAARSMGRPWILTERTSADAYSARLKDRVRARVGRSAAAVIANSSSGLAYWEPRLPPTVIRAVIPNALPLAEIAAAVAEVPEADITATADPLVLFAGRFEGVKNPHAFIDAIAALHPHQRLRACMCGDGPLAAEIDAAIAARGLSSLVQRQGYVANLWGLMKHAAVVVSTSLREGSPNVVLEAMACGCPLVVSDIEGHREWLDDTCATLVSTGDAAGVARAIRTVLVDRESARRRADLAAARARTLAPATSAQAYLEVYAAVLKARR